MCERFARFSEGKPEAGGALAQYQLFGNGQHGYNLASVRIIFNGKWVLVYTRVLNTLKASVILPLNTFSFYSVHIILCCCHWIAQCSLIYTDMAVGWFAQQITFSLLILLCFQSFLQSQDGLCYGALGILKSSEGEGNLRGLRSCLWRQDHEGLLLCAGYEVGFAFLINPCSFPIQCSGRHTSRLP